VLDTLREELEELEETLQDSIAASIKGKKAAAEGDKADKPSKRKRAADSDEELGSSSEDEFYDRTGAPSKKAATAAAAGPGGGKKAAGPAKGQAGQVVESAETLHAKR
jgi:hypothetical protein